MSWHLVYLFVSFITITNKLVLVVLFLFQKENKKFNRFLAIIIGTAIPIVVSNLFNYLNLTQYIEWVFVASAISLLYYPFCILLFHDTLKIPINIDWKFYLYASIPVFYYSALAIGFIFFFDDAIKTEFILSYESYDWNNPVAQAILIPLTISFIVHIVYFVFFLNKAKRLNETFAKEHMIKRRYKFVRTFVIALIGISIVLFMFGFMNFDNEFVDMFIVPMSSNILTVLIVFFAFDGRLVSEESPAFEVMEKEPGNVMLVPKKGIVLEDKRISLKREIDDFFASNYQYCESDFSLQKLALILDISPHHLSFVINAEHGQSFSDLVGYYRIKKAKSIIESTAFDQLTIEGIGQSVGYKSKSTFFTHFKKNTGMTPLDFKKSVACNGYSNA